MTRPAVGFARPAVPAPRGDLAIGIATPRDSGVPAWKGHAIFLASAGDGVLQGLHPL